MSRLTAVAAAVLFSLASFAQAQFLQLPQYGNGTNAATFVQADVNHDGTADILGIQANNNGVPTNIVVLLANGTGGFGAAITTAVSGVDSPVYATVGDFNDDGFPDVAFLGKDHVTGQNAVAVMLGNGNGTFQAGKETVIGGVGSVFLGACIAAAADYNGDGKLDLAYLIASNGVEDVNILLGEGNGSFSTPATSVAVNGSVRCVVAGDFNNDKKIDIAASTSGGVYMLLGEGNGKFETPFAAGTTGGTMIAAEMNADNNLDLVLLQSAPSAVAVLLGDGTGHFPTKHVYDGIDGQLYEAFAVQDLNGDGHPDVAITNENASHQGAVIDTYLNNGEGALTAGKTYDADGNGVAVGILAAALSSNGDIDLAFGNDAGGFTVLAGNGNGTFKGNLATVAPGSGIIVGQFDSNPAPDLLLLEPGTALGITLLGNGDGTFSSVHNAGCGFANAAVGDFNHDGIQDVAGPQVLSDLPVITVCLGKGAGEFTPFGNFDQGVAHTLILDGLFSSNGKLDLVASDDNGFSMLLGDGNGSFANGIPTAVNGSLALAAGSFFTNAKVDVVTTSSSGVEVFPGNGDGTFGAPVVTPGSPTSGKITVTDLNLDGKKDLVVVTGGHITVMLGNGNGTFNDTTYVTGLSTTTKAIVADFNGDGIPDVAVGTNGGVAVFFGKAGGVLITPPTIFSVGGPVASIGTADLNLDTKPDIAVLMVQGYVVSLLHQ